MNELKTPEMVVRENESCVSDETVEVAMKLLEEWKTNSGTSPSGQAGTSLYIASSLTGENLSQSEVCEMVGTSTMTIRKHSSSLEKKIANLLINRL